MGENPADIYIELLKYCKIDITNLNIALREKDDTKRSYLQALKSLWLAYYDLRRLTLYDFANEKLLHVREE